MAEQDYVFSKAARGLDEVSKRRPSILRRNTGAPLPAEGSYLAGREKAWSYGAGAAKARANAGRLQRGSWALDEGANATRNPIKRMRLGRDSRAMGNAASDTYGSFQSMRSGGMKAAKVLGRRI